MANYRLKKKSGYWLLGATLLTALLAWLLIAPQHQAKPQAKPKSAVRPQPTKPAGLQTAAVPRALVEKMRQLAQTDKAVAQKPKPQKSKPQAQKPKAQKPKTQAPKPNHTYRRKAQDQPSTAMTTEQNGAIPELIIDLGDHTPDAMAHQYGLVLAAQSFAANTLLGIFEAGQLKALSSDALSQYATRGRSAAGLAEEFTFKRRAANASSRPFDDIGLLYLVPRTVDHQWTLWQRQVVEAAGYPLVEVAAVHARCNPDLTLRAGHLVLKEGSTVALAGATP